MTIDEEWPGVVFTNREPVYLQVVKHFKEMIATGRLSSGQSIPSRRELASRMKINPNTAQKAYKEMEEQKLIVTEGNSPSRITLDAEVLNSIRSELLGEAVDAFVLSIRRLEAPVDELLQLVRDKYTIHHIETGQGVERGRLMIEISDIRKKFRRKGVLNGVSFQVAKGQITSLIGLNGAGKSTVLKAIMGLTPIDGGSITIDGMSLGPQRYNQVAFIPDRLPIPRTMRAARWTPADGGFLPPLECRPSGGSDELLPAGSWGAGGQAVQGNSGQVQSGAGIGAGRRLYFDGRAFLRHRSVQP